MPVVLRLPWFLLALVSIATPADDAWFSSHENLMGTRAGVELLSANKRAGETCAAKVFAEMHRIDALMSSYREDSEVSKINQHAADYPVRVSRELYQLIQRSLDYSELSKGAFDISYASIGYQYDYRAHKQPDEQTILNKLPLIDYRQIKLQDSTVFFNQPGMRIDLGGIAKGYAVDRAIEIVKQCGIDQALVNAGGDTRIIGDRQGYPWLIGIQHPRQQTEIALRIPLSDTAVSTSGDYQRFYFSQGERIHHIINPNTGKSAKKSWSATVIAPTATASDALSTTIFILGATDGLALINRLADTEAVIIDAQGKIHYSQGLQPPENQPK